jgi:hypothetical protein
MWGVLTAEIVGDGVVEAPGATLDHELDPALLSAAREEVELLFVHNDRDHPAIKELLRICIDRRATRAS